MILVFDHFAQAWGHHPRFSEITRAIAGRNAFWHNINQFATASILFDVGNRVGIDFAAGDGSRSADLYVRADALSKLKLEVKAPMALHWPYAATPDSYIVEKTACKLLKSSVGQLNRRNRGILVIETSLDDAGLEPEFFKALEHALRRKGRDYRGVAGILGLCCRLVWRRSENKLTMAYTSQIALNPHYDGENPIRFGDPPNRMLAL